MSKKVRNFYQENYLNAVIDVFNYIMQCGFMYDYLTVALPNAKQVVITAGNPSGIAATAKATAILK